MEKIGSGTLTGTTKTGAASSIRLPLQTIDAQLLEKLKQRYQRKIKECEVEYQTAKATLPKLSGDIDGQ